ncbi:MAG: PEP/pyruvate-binding domain-containing protein [Planctomycetota bacterium]
MIWVPLEQADQAEEFGGKAANLARVAALGYAVPEGIAVARTVLRDALARQPDWPSRWRRYVRLVAEADSATAAAAHRDLAAPLRAAPLLGAVREALVAPVTRLLAAADAGLAVRSSALYEDSPRASFAGVFESYLGVADLDAVCRRICDCWISGWSPRALRYLARMGLEPGADAMAVLVQRVVPTQCAGVIYTADPDSGNPWQFAVQAVPGLADDLMSGSGVGDGYRLAWNTGAVLSRDLALSGNASGEGTLPAAAAQSLAAAALGLDRAFGTRLDIEWAFAADGLRIVQARPLTALPEFFAAELDTAERESTWRPVLCTLPLRSDQPPHLITPLYRDLSEAEMWTRYQPDDIVLTMAWRESRDWLGYRYMREETIPTFVEFFASPGDYEAWLDRNEPHYRRRWDERGRELRTLADDAAAAIRDTATAAELIPTMLAVRDRFWDLNSFGWSGPQSLGWMCESLLGHVLAEIAPDDAIDASIETIVAGGAESFTLLVTRSLQELGRAIDEPDVQRVFASVPLEQVLPVLQRHHPECRFLGRYEELCWQLGRTPPSWQGRPPFWRLGHDHVSSLHTVRAALRGEARDVVAAQRQSRARRDAATDAVRQHVTAAARERFDKIVAWAREWTRALNDRHGLAPGLLWEKELIWRVGERLVRERVAKQPADLLLLYREDLLEFVSTGEPHALAARLTERQDEFEHCLRLTAPAVLGRGRADTPSAGAPATELPAEAEASGGLWHGVPFARGSVTGRARVVADVAAPDLLDSLAADDILVLPCANAFAYADWHSLLTVVCGVVSPGRPAHHLSQVARECGVPVLGEVCLPPGRIDGAKLHLDANAGVLRLL